jgi:hypothetical protein
MGRRWQVCTWVRWVAGAGPQVWGQLVPWLQQQVCSIAKGAFHALPVLAGQQEDAVVVRVVRDVHHLDGLVRRQVQQAQGAVVVVVVDLRR